MRILMHVMYACMLCARVCYEYINSGMTEIVQSLIEDWHNQVVFLQHPCIHATNSTSMKTTTQLLEEDFSHFGYPHAIISDNATTFSSQEFKTWCHERGMVHLTGAPYHPATNSAAERLVQTFKRFLKKSKKSPKEALQEFLMQYRRSPLASGYSPSELLNNRQI